MDEEDKNNKNNSYNNKEKNYNKDKKDNNNYKVESIPFNPEQFFPWITKKSLSQKNRGILKLHFEIIEFYNFIKPTKKENEIRIKTFKEIN